MPSATASSARCWPIKPKKKAWPASNGIVTGYGHVNYDAIPSVIFTYPEIAAVGKTEDQLIAEKIAYRKGIFPFRANSRARTLGEVDGKVKILADAKTDRVLGVHILGPQAGDLIAEAATAMNFGAVARRYCPHLPRPSDVARGDQGSGAGGRRQGDQHVEPPARLTCAIRALLNNGGFCCVQVILQGVEWERQVRRLTRLKRQTMKFHRYTTAFAAIAVFCGTRSTSADEPVTIPKFTDWVIGVAFSPLDGSLASVGGQGLPYRPGDVKIWDPADGKLKLSLDGHASTVWAVAFSPDGKTMATAAYDGTIKLWDMPEGKPKSELKKHKHWARALAFTPDGKQLVSGSEDTNVIVWEVDSGKDLKTIQAHAGPVNSLAISPDGKTLATAGGDKLAKLWDLEKGTEKAKLEGHQDAVLTIAFRKDASLLATGGADREVRLWSADGKLQGSLPGHKDWVTCVVFSPADGNLLASAASTTPSSSGMPTARRNPRPSHSRAPSGASPFQATASCSRSGATATRSSCGMLPKRKNASPSRRVSKNSRGEHSEQR